MFTRETRVRLGIEGDAAMKRALRETGEIGDKALDRITTGARPASRGLAAVDRASQNLKGEIDGLASRAGGFGSVLTALGPAGLGAAAGIGATVAGLARGATIARDAVEQFDAIGKTADKIGVTTDFLQEMRVVAGDLAGLASGQLDTALQRFNRRMSEAAQGGGSALKTVRELGIELTGTDGRLRSTEDLLGQVARGLKDTETEADQLRIAFSLFDTEGAAMVNVLRDGGAAMDETREKARAMGLVVREDVIRGAEDMQSQFDLASQVMNTQLQQAFIGLAPMLLTTAQGFADLATRVGDFVDGLRAVEERGARGLEMGLNKTLADLSKTNVALQKTEDNIKKLRDIGVSDDSGILATPLRRAEALRAQMAELRAEEDRFIAELSRREDARTAPRGTISPLPSSALPARTVSSAAKKDAPPDFLADFAAFENEKRRAAADVQRIEETTRALRRDGVDAAKDRLRIAMEEESILRAGLDAQEAAFQAGARGDALTRAREIAEGELRLKYELADATRALGAEEKEISAERSASAKREADAIRQNAETESALMDAQVDAFRKAADERKETKHRESELERENVRKLAARRREAHDKAISDALEYQEALNNQLDAERDLERFRTASIDIISGGQRAGTANSLAELEAIRADIRAAADANAIRAAGDSAADGAGRFEDAAGLRDIAEQRARIAISIRDANEALRERGETLNEELRRTEELAQVEARRAADEERAQQVRLENDRRIIQSLAQQAREWRSIGDAAKDLLFKVVELGAEPFFNGLFGGGGQQSSGFGQIAQLLGSGLSQAFGGSGLAPAVSPIPIVRPRAGGGPVSAGEFYRVNEFGGEGFRPNQSGTIIPLGEMPAPVINVYTSDPNTRVTTGNRFGPSRAQAGAGLALAAQRGG